MPVIVAVGVNLGVVPLLFVQLAYHRVFYPATILMAWFWLGIIVLLIPLALRGVKYRPLPATQLLRRNLLIYGVGGLIVPFIGIKIIDLMLQALGLA